MYFRTRTQQPYVKTNDTTIKSAIHKSCRPKKTAFFVKLTPHRCYEEYGWWSGKFEEDLNDFEIDIKSFLSNTVSIFPYSMRIVAKTQYDYVSMTFIEEKDALAIVDIIHHKKRNGYTFVADIIKGEIDDPDAFEDEEVLEYGGLFEKKTFKHRYNNQFENHSFEDEQYEQIKEVNVEEEHYKVMNDDEDQINEVNMEKEHYKVMNDDEDHIKEEDEEKASQNILRCLLDSEDGEEDYDYF